MEKTVLEKYADLIVRMGVNVQKNQTVVIVADLDQPEFIRILVEKCYQAGASKVTVEFNYQDISKIHYQYRTEEVLGKVEKWEEERYKFYSETLPCRIYIESEDPDGLKGVDQGKIAGAKRKAYPVIKPYKDAMEGKYQWCIAAVPGVKWAKKLFPQLAEKEAVEKLWQAILTTARITDDPIKAWEEHNKEIHDHCEYLNNLGIESLHYKSSNGTDFTVGLIEQGRFSGGSEKSIPGIRFNPNIPTEECFTSPMKGKAEGLVVATKPLSYQGELIENFKITFKDGKAVKWEAEKGEDLLEKMITQDEGSAYLGECALVPYDSPVNLTGFLFYNTLFDENACCHLALGDGFPDCIKDYEKLTLEEIHKLGVNESMNHVDFMIGSRDLEIEAKCRDGRTVPIFKNGNWVK